MNPSSNGKKDITSYPKMTYLPKSPIHGGPLRQDYELPPLHKFLRFEGAALTIWP
jgi:hypothetical protein